MIARLTMRPAAARRIGRYMLAALVALAMTTAAQRASAQAAQPSPTAILLAKQLVEIKHIKDIYVPLVRGVVEKTRDMFMQTNFMWSKDLNDVTDIEFKQYVPRASELVDETARIYATHFTEPELKQLLAFYQSPVGQKALVEEPKIVDESMAKAGSWGDNLSQEVMVSMRAEMKKRGHDM
jgi:hypothetical protein